MFKKKIYRTYSDKSVFNYNSKLSDNEKNKLIKWVNELSEKEAKFLELIIDDAKDNTADFCNIVNNENYDY